MYSPNTIIAKLTENFPTHPLKVNVGRALYLYIYTFLVIAILGTIGAIYYRNAEDVAKFYGIAGTAIAFLLAICIVNFKRFALIYSYNNKPLNLVLVPITSIVTRKSTRGNIVTQITYNWPMDKARMNRAVFSGAEGPLVIPTPDKSTVYALGVMPAKAKTKPYLMDERLARCNLTQSERRKILKAIRGYTKKTARKSS